jgi:hypothetical protein
MKFLFTVAFVGLLVACPAEAQVRAKAKQRILEQQKQKQQQRQAKQADAVERFLQMSPEQRRQALAQLPPARQRQILQRLNTLELLSEDERDLLRGRLQAFSGLPPLRRQAVRSELQILRKLPRDERRRRLGSDEMKENFAEEERELLYDVFGQDPQKEE